MIFLQPLYQFIANHFEERINHFPLVKLIITSLDKTMLYFLIFLVLRFLYLKLTHKQTSKKHEVLLGCFTFYLILLYSLTVFRNIYFPWQLNFKFDRPLSAINLTVWTETAKLSYAASKVDFMYNFWGNILWFIPFGLIYPWLHRYQFSFWKTIMMGALISFSIESLQFVLQTGVSDIDDLIFNVIGVVIGYLMYAFSLKNSRKSLTN